MPSNFGGDQHDPDYNPDARKASRKQRVKRMQMKKQSQRKPRAKKAAAQARAPEVAWHVRARELPIALFHTTIGPIIGHVEPVGRPGDGFNLRLWAPAAIRMGFQPGQPGALVAQYSVTFQPIALVETYLDLSAETPFGRSPVPEALVPAYADYLAQVAAGEHSFARVTTQVQQGVPHEVPIGTRAEDVPAPADPDAVDADPAPAGKADDESTLS